MTAVLKARAKDAFQRAVTAMKNDKGLLFLNLGTATGLLGFCMTDPIPLRTCSIISSSSSIFFALTRKPILSYVPVIWSSLYITVNSVMISNILLSRLDTTLTDMEEEVYTKHFLPFGMRPRQFKKLLDAAKLKEYPAKAVIEKEAMYPSKGTVKLLISGEATAYKNKNPLYSISADNPICFIGDLSLFEFEDPKRNNVEPFMSMVTAENGTVRTLEWDMDYLLKILKEKSEVSQQLRCVLTKSVMRKLLDLDRTNSKSKYITLLRAFAVDGVIDDVEKRVLVEYKRNHMIDDATHARGLAVLGWTEEEFQLGHKKNSFLQSMEKVQGKVSKWKELNGSEDIDEILKSIRNEQQM